MQNTACAVSGHLNVFFLCTLSVSLSSILFQVLVPCCKVLFLSIDHGS